MHDRSWTGPPPVRIAVAALAVALPASVPAHGQVLLLPTLNPLVDQQVPLTLNFSSLSTGTRIDWSTANIAHLFIRSDGRQQSLLPLELDEDQNLPMLVIDRPGPALLCAGIGPPEAVGFSDSWQRTTRCVKIVLDVQTAGSHASQELRPNAGITAKTGQKIEILPLMDPTILSPGSDLGLRVYYEGVKVTGAELAATVGDSLNAASGENVKALRPTDAEGTTWIHLHRAGCWVVRFRHEISERVGADDFPRQQEYVAELIFQIPKERQP